VLLPWAKINIGKPVNKLIQRLPSTFLRTLQSLVVSIDKWTLRTGHAVAWLLVLMVAIQSLIVILRYGFEIGSIALQESVTYLHAACFMLGIAYTVKINGHVRVDIFYRQFSPQKKAVINLFGAIVFLLPLCLFIFITSFEYVFQAWQFKEHSSDTGGLPIVYVLKTLIPLLATGLLLQSISEIGKSILTLVGYPQYAQAEH
jgi:TRAP-type mannitol/chloroaromatic compound transport system permease small subunit